MNGFQAAARYFHYIRKAKGRHGIHSPFVYRFIEEVIRNKAPFYAFEAIARQRRVMRYDNRVLDIRDFGAGSHNMKGTQRRVHQILRHSVIPDRWGRFLFRLSHCYQPASILEMGTSLGIGTAYLAKGWSRSRCITMEGCAATAAVARENLMAVDAGNVEVLVGEFSQNLDTALASLNRTDMVFFDGNHRYAPTMDYFERCLPYVHPGSVFVFHDIHWSREMEKAWEEICRHPQITVSMDLFYLGIVFFRKEQEKEHFVLRYR